MIVALCANPNIEDAWKHPLQAPYWLPFNSPELEKEFIRFDRKKARLRKYAR